MDKETAMSEIQGTHRGYVLGPNEGEQPLIGPGRVHQYQSFCVLKSPRGWMEGQYFLVRADGTPFTAWIPRFDLTTDGAVLH